MIIYLDPVLIIFLPCFVYSVVAPLDILPELNSLKFTAKTVGSFHSATHESKHARPRMGSFPAKLLPLLTVNDDKGKSRNIPLRVGMLVFSIILLHCHT